MRFRWISLVKFFIVCSVLLSFLSLCYKGNLTNPWNTIIMGTCIIVPVLAVFLDSYPFYVIGSIVTALGIISEVFVPATDFALTILFFIASVSSLVLAVEDVALEVGADILTQEWIKSKKGEKRPIYCGMWMFSIASYSEFGYTFEHMQFSSILLK